MMREQGASETIDIHPVSVEATPGGLSGLDGRHPSVRHFAPLFAYGHLPAHLLGVSRRLAGAAAGACNELKDGPELSAGLRKLIEAKDCAVRAALARRLS